MAADNAALVIEMDFDWSKADKGVDEGARKLLQFQSTIEGLASVDFSNLSSQIANLTKNLSKVNSGSGTKDAEIDLQNLAKATAEAELAQLRLTNAQNKGKTVSQGDNYKQLSQNYREAAAEAQDYAAKLVLAGKSLDEIGKDEHFISVSKKAQTAFGQLNQIDQAVGKFGRNVGNYASHWNGLGNAINQLTREAPAFANSLQTGFMAISNNLPTLFDELGKLRTQNKALASEGKPTVSVLGQLAGAVFSWQTALSLGVTLLTVYGKDIVEWAGRLIKGKNAVVDLSSSYKYLNDQSHSLSSSFRSSSVSAQQEIDKLLLLNKIATDNSITYQTRVKAAKDLQSEQTGTLKNYSLEAIMTGKVAEVITKELIPAYKAAAIAQSASSELGRLEVEKAYQETNKRAQESARNRILPDYKEYEKSTKAFVTNLQGVTLPAAIPNRLKTVNNTWNEINKQSAITDNNIKGINNRISILNGLIEKNAKIGAPVIVTGTGNGGGGKPKTTKTPKLTDLDREKKDIEEYNNSLDILSKKLSSGGITQSEYFSEAAKLADNLVNKIKDLKVADKDTLLNKYIGEGNEARYNVKMLAQEIKLQSEKIPNPYDYLKPQDYSKEKIAKPNDLFATDLAGESVEKWADATNILNKRGKDYSKVQDHTLEGMKDMLKNIDMQGLLWAEVKDQVADVGGQIGGTLVQNILSGNNALQSMGGILTGLIAQFASMAAKAALLSIISGGASAVGGGGFSFLGALTGIKGMATGGSVSSGGLYRVNEFGSELFSIGNKQYLMPGANGSIKPITAPNIQSPNMSNAKPNVVRVQVNGRLSGRDIKLSGDNYTNFKSR